MFDIPFRGRQHTIKAAVEYYNDELMRIRVYGKRSSFLLETEYKRKVDGKLRWTIKDNLHLPSNPNIIRLEFDIMACLEYCIDKDFRS